MKTRTCTTLTDLQPESTSHHSSLLGMSKYFEHSQHSHKLPSGLSVASLGSQEQYDPSIADHSLHMHEFFHMSPMHPSPMLEVISSNTAKLGGFKALLPTQARQDPSGLSQTQGSGWKARSNMLKMGSSAVTHSSPELKMSDQELGHSSARPHPL